MHSLLNYGLIAEGEVDLTWLFIVLACLAGAAFLTVLILFFIALSKKRKNEYAIHYESKPIKVSNQDDKSLSFIKGLGGQENIVEHQMVGHRMSFVLQDYSLIKEQQLKELGVESIIKMSNKIILVVKDDLCKLYKKLF